jgi:hypothetical protein
VELSQEVTVTTADTYQLTFNSAFLTSLFTGPFADPNTLDSFLVSLTPSAGPAVNALSGDIASGSFLLFPGLAATPGGSNFFEYTPLTGFAQNFDLTAGTYTLAFRVENASDSLFDSGMVVDSVSLSSGPTSVVPEPSTFLLLGGALASLALWRKRAA